MTPLLSAAMRASAICHIATSEEVPDDMGRLAYLAVAGDEAATRRFLQMAARPMLSVIRRVIGRTSPDAEDILQDALIGLLEALPRFRGESSASHFARRVALFTAMAARRRWRTREQCASDEAATHIPDSSRRASPLNTTIENRRREVLRRVLDRLPEKFAEVLAMHLMLGYTVDEIAATTGVPVSTVRSRLRRGKKACHRRIAASKTLADELLGDDR